jgi:hypothetical protein
MVDSKEALMEETFSADVIPEEVRESLLGAPSKPINKPEIGHLPDAIVDGYPAFGVGDKIIIERRSVVLAGKPYIDTKSYRVISVDMAGGNVHLYDGDLDQFAMTNWRTGLLAGFIFKFANGKAVVTKRKRGRPRKNPTPEALPSRASEGLNQSAPAGEKKGRGRPKGTKNRSKEEIQAEKQERSKVAAAKRAARAAKKASKPKTHLRASAV